MFHVMRETATDNPTRENNTADKAQQMMRKRALLKSLLPPHSPSPAAASSTMRKRIAMYACPAPHKILPLHASPRDKSHTHANFVHRF